jgi:hypothetical protein
VSNFEVRDLVNIILEGLKVNKEAFLKSLLKDVLNSLEDDLESYELIEDILSKECISSSLYSQIDSLPDTCKDTTGILLVLRIMKQSFKPLEDNIVYFILNTSGRVKIGFTSNLDQRFKSLVNSSGDDLTILYTYSPVNTSISELESKLHYRYAKYRVIGEWFVIDPYQDFKVVCEQFDK